MAMLGIALIYVSQLPYAYSQNSLGLLMVN